MRDLAEVVHDPDAGEAGRFGARRDVAEVAAHFGRPARPGVHGELQAEAQTDRLARMLRNMRSRSGHVSGSGPDDRRLQDRVETLGLERWPLFVQLPNLAGQDLRRKRLAPSLVASPALSGGGGEHDADRRHVMLSGEVQPHAPPDRIEPERVDDRGQSASSAVADDLLQERERILARGEIFAGLADHSAEAVARHDLLAREVLSGPGRLAGARRSDQHDEAGRWQHHLVGHRPLLRCDVGVFSAGRLGRGSNAGRRAPAIARHRGAGA